MQILSKIMTSNNVSFGKKRFKYLISYKDDEEVKRFCIMPPIMSWYENETKNMFFLLKMVSCLQNIIKYGG